MENIVLIGGGGHCKSVIDTIESSKLYNIIGIIDKNEKLNYGTQRHFCLAAVVAHDLQSEQLLRQKYAAFKSRFASEKELKGNSLFAKS